MGRIIINETDNKQTVILETAPEGVTGGYFDEDQNWHKLGDSSALFSATNIDLIPGTWHFGRWAANFSNRELEFVIRPKGTPTNNSEVVSVGEYNHLTESGALCANFKVFVKTSNNTYNVTCYHNDLSAASDYVPFEDSITVKINSSGVYANDKKLMDISDEMKALTLLSIGEMYGSSSRFSGYFDKVSLK